MIYLITISVINLKIEISKYDCNFNPKAESNESLLTFKIILTRLIQIL